MRLIVFEGLDGSGKSTLMKGLEGELQKRAIPFIQTREPGGTPLGDQIRELLLKKGDSAPTPRTELLLYEASRSQHVDMVISPALKKGQYVLCDRFSASSIAFQAGGRGVPQSVVESLNQFATNGLEADLTVLLDLPVEVSVSRRDQRALVTGEEHDRIESEAQQFHEKVRKSFLDQAENNSKWLVLDATQPKDNLLQQLLSEFKSRGWFS
jgi:dTMP kinase